MIDPPKSLPPDRLPRGRWQMGLLAGLVLFGMLLRWQLAMRYESPQLPREFTFGDSYSYWELSGDLLAGRPYERLDSTGRVFRTPGYPLFLAAARAVLGDEPARGPLLAANAWAAGMSVLAVYWWGCKAFGHRNAFGQRAALVAAGLTALMPDSVAMGVFVLAEALFVPFMLLHLTCHAMAAEAVGWRRSAWAVTAGMVGGAAVLTRPSWLLFFPFAAIVTCLASRDRLRHLHIAGCMAAGCGLIMMPWWVRNVQATGHFVGTTLQVGSSLYDGLNPHADGSSNMEFTYDFHQQETARPSSADPSFEYRLDQRMRKAALHWAAQNPGQVVRLAGIKFARFWNPWPNEPMFQSAWIKLATALGLVPVLAAAGWSAWKFRPLNMHVALCLLPAVYFTLLHMVFVSSIRYRGPAMVPLYLLAAAAVAAWTDARTKQTAGPTSA